MIIFVISIELNETGSQVSDTGPAGPYADF